MRRTSSTFGLLDSSHGFELDYFFFQKATEPRTFSWPNIQASDKVSPSDLLYMNKLLEFSTNTKLDAPNATLEGKIV